MKFKENIIFAKSKKFALRIVKLYQYLTDKKKEFVLSKQILRSGTSIGANLAEANCAISRKDFLSKTYISFKECSETLYWLELLHAAGYLNDKEFGSVYEECEEMMRLLSAITKTTKGSV